MGGGPTSECTASTLESPGARRAFELAEPAVPPVYSLMMAASSIVAAFIRTAGSRVTRRVGKNRAVMSSLPIAKQSAVKPDSQSAQNEAWLDAYGMAGRTHHAKPHGRTDSEGQRTQIGGSNECRAHLRPSVARQFDVAASAVIKWVQRYSETRSAGLSRMGGYCRPKLEGRRACVLEQIRARPSITLAGLRDRLGDREEASRRASSRSGAFEIHTSRRRRRCCVRSESGRNLKPASSMPSIAGCDGKRKKKTPMNMATRPETQGNRPVHSRKVAEQVLWLRDGQETTPMHVIKLAYLCHGWMLGIHARSLLSEPVEAWRYGPVVPSIHRRYKSFRTDAIETELVDRSSDLDDDQKRIMSDVIEAYREYEAWMLSSITHKRGTPWDKTYRWGLGEGAIIPNKLIRRHYERMARA